MSNVTTTTAIANVTTTTLVNDTTTTPTTTTAITTAAPTPATTTTTTIAGPAGTTPRPIEYIRPAMNLSFGSVVRNAGAALNPHLDADTGGAVVLIVCSVVALVVAIVAVLMYKRNWELNAEAKRKKEELRVIARRQAEARLINAAVGVDSSLLVQQQLSSPPTSPVEMRGGAVVPLAAAVPAPPLASPLLGHTQNLAATAQRSAPLVPQQQNVYDDFGGVDYRPPTAVAQRQTVVIATAEQLNEYDNDL